MAIHKIVTIVAILTLSTAVLLSLKQSDFLQPAPNIAAPEPVCQNETSIVTSTSVSDSLSITDKVAVIIENRLFNSLIPLILHFAAVLGPTWPIILYTSSEVMDSLQNSTALARMERQIQVRPLPAGTEFRTHGSVSKFLTDRWLWEDLAPAERVLLFQADSMICSNAQQSMDDFLEYDFIGAPIRQEFGRGYNGGLSIRNRRKVLDIVTEFDWEAEKSSPTRDTPWQIDFEDQWMVMKMSESLDPRLPSQEIAQTFAVETIYYDKPLGYHQVTRWWQDSLSDIQSWCPEVSLAIGSTFA